MTKAEIVEMAREAGAHEDFAFEGEYFDMSAAALERFSELVRATEREACAELVENFAVDIDDEWVLRQAAKAIREKERT